MFVLRDYQKECVNAAGAWIESKKDKKIPFIVVPTGGGKSLIIAEIAKNYGSKVLCLQPSKELLIQNHQKYISYGLEASLYSASAGRRDFEEDVIFATPGTVLNDKEIIKSLGIDLVLVDECHLQCAPSSKLGAFLKEFKEVRCIGFTATPLVMMSNSVEGVVLKLLNRTNKKSIFTNILYEVPISKMIKGEYWPKIEYIRHQEFEKNIQLNRSRSEYSELAVEEMIIDSDGLIEIQSILNEYPDRSTLIFVPTIRLAKTFSQATPLSGVVFSGMPDKERDIIISNFKSGIIKYLFNVNILSIGFDFPGLIQVIDANPTLSFARFYQKLGRLLRKLPGKDVVYYHDMAKSMQNFGAIENINLYNCPVKGWNLYKGDIQLTNCPIDGTIVIKKVIAQENVTANDILMPFGRHIGKKVSSLSSGYLEWCISEFDFPAKYQHIKREMEKVLSVRNKLS